MIDRLFFNHQNKPIRCKANGYTHKPPGGFFLSVEMNKKWDKKRKDWDERWGDEHLKGDQHELMAGIYEDIELGTGT